ncbi:MAG: hypothetical protein OEZ02_02435 [Anaerolineae bacterium]|nr:hypothetical protein [Anaerolineae bacterium]
MSAEPHVDGLGELNERRFLATLHALAALLHTHKIETWAARFDGDLKDYVDAQGPPRQAGRQLAVIEHVLTAFGGLSDFKQLVLTDEVGEPLPDANQRLADLSANLWASARSTQAFVMQHFDIIRRGEHQ